MGEPINIKERVLHFAKIKRMSIESFLEPVGISYSAFRGKAKQGTLNSDAIYALHKSYPDMNLSWLVCGEGEPVVKEVSYDVRSVVEYIYENMPLFLGDAEFRKLVRLARIEIKNGALVGQVEELQRQIARLNKITGLDSKEQV